MFKIVMKKILLLSLVIASGCATGTKHPTISAKQVKIYSEPPAKYESLGVVVAHAHRSLFGHRAATWEAVARLKKYAAENGANGVLLSPAQAKLISDPTHHDETEDGSIEISGTAIFVQ
jgi:hypothetical protein